MAAGRAKSTRAVGRYQLVHELAQSYLGPLWAVRVEGGDGATHLAMLRLVSLARLDADTRVRLLEAAWQAMEVRDDRICPVTDVVASDGELGLVSDYVEGVTLRGLASFASVRRKPASAAIAVRVALDLLSAVSALHRTTAELGDEAVPLYGGLSADSVLLAADGRTLVLDVALTSAASTIETLGGNPERAAYAAPEQLRVPSTADARTDLFTVGVLLWELLACRRLFVGSDKAVSQKVLTSKIPRPDELRRKGDPEMPDALVVAVMKALERDPSARPESAETFAASLADAGIVPAAREEVARYVTTLAEGALQRARDAIARNKSSGTHPALTRTTGKPASPLTQEVARRDHAVPVTKPPLPVRVEPNPLRPTRTDVKPTLAPRTEAKPALPPRTITRPAQGATTKAATPVVSSPRVVTSTPTADAATTSGKAADDRQDRTVAVRARQPTMIGLPAVSMQTTGGAKARIPDAFAAPAEPINAAPKPTAREPEPWPALDSPMPASQPILDGSDEELTTQFTSSDLLQHVDAMGRQDDASRSAPTDLPDDMETTVSEAHAPTPDALQTLPDLTPLDVPADGGWLDDPASPPPSPVIDRQQTIPDAPGRIAEWKADDSSGSGAELLAAVAADGFTAAPDRPVVSKALERLSPSPGPPLFSVAPPAKTSMAMSMAPAAYQPAQISPPLIHDPRARAAPARKAPTPTPAGAEGATRSPRRMAVLVALSLALVITSAAIAIAVLRSRRESDEPGAARAVSNPPIASALSTSEAMARAPVPSEPAPGASVAAPSSPAAVPSTAAPNAADDAAPPSETQPAKAQADNAPALPVAQPPKAPPPTAKPTAPAAKHAASAKKNGRYVPDGI